MHDKPYKTVGFWSLSLVSLIFVMTACHADVPGPSTVVVTPDPASTTPLAETLHVELDVFSGLPNPDWWLSAEEAQRFRTLVASLPSSPQQTFAEPLGYRGFVVQGLDPAGEETRWRVSEGAVEIGNSRTALFYTDTDRQLEKWLLQTGRPHLPADLYRTIASQFEAAS